MADEIRQYFEAEAEELIARLTRGVAALDGQELEAAGAQDMLRAAHTLKGAAHVVGEKKLAKLAHDFEDGVAAYRAEPTAAGGIALVRMVDGLSTELKGGEARQEGGVKREEKTGGGIAGEVRSGQMVRVGIGEARKLLDGVRRAIGW